MLEPEQLLEELLYQPMANLSFYRKSKLPLVYTHNGIPEVRVEIATFPPIEGRESQGEVNARLSIKGKIDDDTSYEFCGTEYVPFGQINRNFIASRASVFLNVVKAIAKYDPDIPDNIRIPHTFIERCSMNPHGFIKVEIDTVIPRSGRIPYISGGCYRKVSPMGLIQHRNTPYPLEKNTDIQLEFLYAVVITESVKFFKMFKTEDITTDNVRAWSETIKSWAASKDNPLNRFCKEYPL